MTETPVFETYEPVDFLDLLSEKDLEIRRLRSRLEELEGGPVDSVDRPEVADGIVPYWRTPDGWTVATIRYDIVPGYDFEAACEGLSPEAIRQEILIDWSATRGKRVYPEYGKIHEAAHPLVYDPRRPLYCGWDFGSHDGGTPAFVITQINTFGQLLVFPPIAPLEDESIGTYAFGQIVADHIQKEYAGKVGKKWRDLQMLHFGDPNGNQRPPRTGDSKREMVTHFQILQHGVKIPLGTDEFGNTRYERKPGFGFKIQPGPVNVSERLGAVRARLNLLLPGALPALVVDPRATVIKDGFAGGYHHKKKADGNFEDLPEKNWYSHSFDALAYVVACLFVTPEEQDDSQPRAGPKFRCQAAARMG